MEKKNNTYSIKGLEKCLNRIVNFVFYYRMAFVLLFIILSFCFCYYIGISSDKANEVRNITFVVTCTSIVIGIFYTILNYEHNQIKSISDEKYNKLVHSYNTVCDWHKPAMVENLKITRQFYDKNKHLINEGKAKDFYEIVDTDDSARGALVSIFNYLECLAIGIQEGVLDERFIKEVFKTLFICYFNDYFFYISYRRKLEHTPTSWICFTGIAKKWENIKDG